MNKKSPKIMTAGQINKCLDKLDAEISTICKDLIAAGRGRETINEIFKMTDPLSIRYKDLDRERFTYRMEVERRYGPGAPSRLPLRGFGPIKESW
jgi:hypothetical protein